MSRMEKIAHHKMLAKLALLKAKKALSNAELAKHLNARTRHQRIALNLALYGIEV
jgi:hypothetical protein